MSDKTKGIIREYAESIIIALVLALVIRAFVVQAFKIPTGSMRPTLLENDRILVNKFIYGAQIPFIRVRLPAVREPKRGDIIVFKYPEDPKKDFIKRLIASGGETVEIIGGKIAINGTIIKDGILNNINYCNFGPYGQEGMKVRVPKDCYFVLGDNSMSSKDSRYWGFVPKRNLEGEAFFIFWPIKRIGTIK
jgi:signal peptidase I